MIDFVDTQQISQDIENVDKAENLLAQNTELDNRFNQTVLPSGDISQTQNVNPNLLTKAPTGIMQNLTSTEQALLDPLEQQIAMRT